MPILWTKNFLKNPVFFNWMQNNKPSYQKRIRQYLSIKKLYPKPHFMSWPNIKKQRLFLAINERKNIFDLKYLNSSLEKIEKISKNHSFKDGFANLDNFSLNLLEKKKDMEALKNLLKEVVKEIKFIEAINKVNQRG